MDLFFFCAKAARFRPGGERGSSLIEVAAGLGLLGIIGVAFLSALATSSNSRLIADEQAAARILAESQIENLKKQTYAAEYDEVPVPAEYAGYFADVYIDPERNGFIQKITVTIRHHNKDITTLECYKVCR